MFNIFCAPAIDGRCGVKIDEENLIMTEIPGMDELKKNIAAYNSMKEELERDNFGRIALFHDGKLIAIYNDRNDAYDIACEKFGVGNFSLRQIGENPASFGGASMYLDFVSIRT